MNGIAFAVRYPKRIMLVAAGAIAQNATVYRRSVCGVSCFSAFIKADTDKIVIGQTLKNIALCNAVFDDGIVNATLKKILGYLICGGAFLRQEQNFWLFFLLRSDSQGRHNRRLSHQGFHRFDKGIFLYLYEIIKSIIPADSLRPPHPLAV